MVLWQAIAHLYDEECGLVDPADSCSGLATPPPAFPHGGRWEEPECTRTLGIGDAPGIGRLGSRGVSRWAQSNPRESSVALTDLGSVYGAGCPSSSPTCEQTRARTAGAGLSAQDARPRTDPSRADGGPTLPCVDTYVVTQGSLASS